MKKVIFLVVMTLLALNSCRANASEKTFYHFREHGGQVLICADGFSYQMKGAACRYGWRYPHEVVPRGRKYIGYKISGGVLKIFYT